MTNYNEKEKIRRSMIKKRAQFSRSNMLKVVNAYGELLKDWLFQNVDQKKESTSMGLYWPFSHEIPHYPLWNLLISENIELYFPRVNHEYGGHLISEGAVSEQFNLLWEKLSSDYIIEHEEVLGCGDFECDLPESFEYGFKNIIEPKLSIIKEGFCPDIIMVPGLAFSNEGYRIGYGGGYYDGFIKDVKRRELQVVSFSLVLDFQLISNFPRSEWDQPVDWLFVNQSCIKTKSK